MKIAAFLFTDEFTQAARNTRLMLVCLIWCSALMNVEVNCQRILLQICLRIGLLYVRLVFCVIIFIDSWKYDWQKWSLWFVVLKIGTIWSFFCLGNYIRVFFDAALVWIALLESIWPYFLVDIKICTLDFFRMYTWKQSSGS